MLSVTQAQKNNSNKKLSIFIFFHADFYSMQKAGRFSAHLGTMLISVTTLTSSDTWHSLKVYGGNFKTNR